MLDSFNKCTGRHFLRYLTVFFFSAILAFQLLKTSFAGYMNPLKEDEIKNRINNILSSGEYQKQKKGKSILEMLAEVIKDLFDWIKEKVEALIDRKISFPAKGLSDSTILVLKILGISILIGISFFLIYFLLRNVRMAARAKQNDDAELLSTLKNPELLEQKALEACESGEYRQGIRLLYISLLLRLNELNVIKVNKAKTNKQYLGEMLENAFIKYKDVQEFTRAFDRYWYGNRNADKKDFDYWYVRYCTLKKGGEE